MWCVCFVVCVYVCVHVHCVHACWGGVDELEGLLIYRTLEHPAHEIVDAGVAVPFFDQ